MKKDRLRVGWRTGLAGALIGLLALTGAQAANAAPTIDPAAEGSITIHKHRQSDPASTTESNGMETTVDTTAYPALGNVGFTAYSVDVDLTTNSGWTDLAALNADFDPLDPPNYGLPAGTIGGAVDTGYTATNGTLVFDELAPGAYLVVETDSSAATDSNGDPIVGGITPAIPFIVTVPMTHPVDLNTWVYDVHVYPKNSISTVGKTIADGTTVKVGDNVTYTLTSDIPDGVTLSEYVVRDNFNAKLEYVSSTVELIGTGAPTLTLGTHYTIDTTAAPTVDVVFTAAGLAVLEANPSLQVQVTHTAKVLETGEIVNEPIVIVNDTEIPGQEVVTKFGNIVIQKNDESGDPLPGAKFSVFLTETDARAGTNPISLDSETVFESDADGIALIEGLRYSGWANGVAVVAGDAGYRTYWIAEVESPAGYELLANPIELVVDALSTTVPTQTIVNVPKFELPITGGAGSLALLLGGSLLTLGGVTLLVRRRRKAFAVA